MDDMLGLSGKTAIVWGGGYSMGEAYVNRLVRAGCDVAVADIIPERADRVAAAVREAGRRSVALHADARDPEAVEKATAEAEAALGSVQLMATVIGFAQWGPMIDMSLEVWRQDLAQNLETFFFTAQAAAKRMQKAGGGAIVGTVSVSGLTTAPRHGAYGVAKAGLVNLVRTMASELGPEIRVNAVSPGAVETLRLVEQLKARGEEHLNMSHLPMRRAGTPDDMAKAGLFLLSDLASYVTGQTLSVDGGWLATYLTEITVSG